MSKYTIDLMMRLTLSALIHLKLKHLETRTRQGSSRCQTFQLFLLMSNPFLLLVVSVVSTTQTHLETSEHLPVSEGITRKMEVVSSLGTGVSGQGGMAPN